MMACKQALCVAVTALLLICAAVRAQDNVMDAVGEGGVRAVMTMSTDGAAALASTAVGDAVMSDYSADDSTNLQSSDSAQSSSPKPRRRRPSVTKGLAQRMAGAKAGATVQVLLSFSETMDRQSLRRLAPGCTADQLSDPACQAAHAEAQAAGDALADRRIKALRRYLRKLGVSIKASDITGSYAIGNIFLARLTTSQVADLQDAIATGAVSQQDGDYMQLRAIEDPLEPLVQQQTSCTGMDSYSFTDPSFMRTATTSDAFFSATADPVATGLRIALIDQGLNRNHVLLQGRTGVWGDCSLTSNSCGSNGICTGTCCRRTIATNAPVDSCTSYGTPEGSGTPMMHGSACASVLVGGSACTSNYRGHSNFVVDFFKALTTNDIVNAFQAGVRSGALVISTSLGVSSSLEAGSATSLAADGAYDAGAIVFAAAGNFGCNSTVNGACNTNWGYSTTGGCNAPIAGSVMAPANAHRVIAVGAFSAGAARTTAAMRTAQPMCYSARGPTRNGRTKPDIIAPTGVEAAYTSNNNAVAYFSGTSAATPNAAGAFATFMAYRMQNKGASGSVPSKGEFMASIIAAGENYGAANNNVGAGAYRPGVVSSTTVDNSGVNLWATTTFTSAGQTATITNMTVTDTSRALKCAVWWPASASTMANNVDLLLLDPSDTPVVSSTQTTSVWEKVALPSTASPGSYTLQIKAVSIGTPQLVHAFCFL